MTGEVRRTCLQANVEFKNSFIETKFIFVIMKLGIFAWGLAERMVWTVRATSWTIDPAGTRPITPLKFDQTFAVTIRRVAGGETINIRESTLG